MKNFKTKVLNRKAIEHLKGIGYRLDENIEKLIDSPFIIAVNGELFGCVSVSEYQGLTAPEKTQQQVLKLTKPLPKNKKLTKKEKDIYGLLKLLNSKKISNITGYDVSWSIQESKLYEDKYEIFPISPHACGSISMEHMEVILDYLRDKNWLYPSFTYTNWNQEKERYGTSTPCIRVDRS